MEEKIIPGKHVSLTYDLYAVNEDGTEGLVHQSNCNYPDQIIFGVTPGVPLALQKALDGLNAGDEFNFVAKPEEAFGDYSEENILALDKDLFIIDGKFDSKRVAVGHVLPMLTAEGFRINGIVTEVKADKVTLDFNDPLAGETVRFQGKVQAVRNATEKELHIALNPGGCCGGCCGGDGEGCDCDKNEGEGCGCDKGCGCK